MSANELVLRFLAGGAMVVVVSLLGKSSHPTLAGMAILFPAVTLVSFSFLSATSSAETLGRIGMFSIYSIPATVAFLAVFTFTVQKVGAGVGLGLGVCAWVGVAAVLLVLNRLVLHL